MWAGKSCDRRLRYSGSRSGLEGDAQRLRLRQGVAQKEQGLPCGGRPSVRRLTPKGAPGPELALCWSRICRSSVATASIASHSQFLLIVSPPVCCRRGRSTLCQWSASALTFALRASCAQLWSAPSLVADTPTALSQSLSVPSVPTLALLWLILAPGLGLSILAFLRPFHSLRALACHC